ncbi:MAG: hypothetical protein QG623_199 [Patescibacteria group bacterium]|nr:hypothetical protein [Patescibacteria group bacterium]
MANGNTLRTHQDVWGTLPGPADHRLDTILYIGIEVIKDVQRAQFQEALDYEDRSRFMSRP